jgi:hypothetical protein
MSRSSKGSQWVLGWRGAHADAVVASASCCCWPGLVLEAVAAMGHGVGVRGSRCVWLGCDWQA